MIFFTAYKNGIKIAIATITCMFFGWFLYNTYVCDYGVVDYVPYRDKAAVKKMFYDDWQLLYYGDWDKITIDSYNVDFMLDNRSSSQYASYSNLTLKVMRDCGKTVGFLAYYPNSPYWWHMLFLIVDKDYRKKGYASTMIQYMIDDLVSRGVVKITTFTRLVNTRARALYEGKFGFKDIAHHDGKYMDLVLYPKKK